MLAIRLQRTGRSGHAQYRVIVQDSRRSPKSGNVVARLGSYNPHTKAVTIDKEKAQTYLKNGAQPSDRVVGLLKSEGVKMPKWVAVSTPGKRTTRNPDKLRKNQPDKPAKEAKNQEPKAEEASEPAEAPAKEIAEKAPEVEASEAPAAEPAPAEKSE
jgi:small subunit ribosomal protein S16